MAEDTDFTLIPESAWNLITSWFGASPAIDRKVVSSDRTDHSSACLFIELRPPTFYIARILKNGVEDSKSKEKIHFSRGKS